MIAHNSLCVLYSSTGRFVRECDQRLENTKVEFLQTYVLVDMIFQFGRVARFKSAFSLPKLQNFRGFKQNHPIKNSEIPNWNRTTDQIGLWSMWYEQSRRNNKWDFEGRLLSAFQNFTARPWLMRHDSCHSLQMNHYMTDLHSFQTHLNYKPWYFPYKLIITHKLIRSSKMQKEACTLRTIQFNIRSRPGNGDMLVTNMTPVGGK